jgi:hypothetical protein
MEASDPIRVIYERLGDKEENPTLETRLERAQLPAVPPSSQDSYPCRQTQRPTT